LQLLHQASTIPRRRSLTAAPVTVFALSLFVSSAFGSMELSAAVFGTGISVWDAQRLQSLEQTHAKVFAAALDTMGALSAEVRFLQLLKYRLHTIQKIVACCNAFLQFQIEGNQRCI
jgi:hypothetical protein